jgi:hypothetical protein
MYSNVTKINKCSERSNRFLKARDLGGAKNLNRAGVILEILRTSGQEGHRRFGGFCAQNDMKGQGLESCHSERAILDDWYV